MDMQQTARREEFVELTDEVPNREPADPSLARITQEDVFRYLKNAFTEYASTVALMNGNKAEIEKRVKSTAQSINMSNLEDYVLPYMALPEESPERAVFLHSMNLLIGSCLDKFYRTAGGSSLTAQERLDKLGELEREVNDLCAERKPGMNGTTYYPTNRLLNYGELETFEATGSVIISEKKEAEQKKVEQRMAVMKYNLALYTILETIKKAKEDRIGTGGTA